MTNGFASNSDYFVATAVLYSLSWLYRQVRIYAEYGINHRAQLSLVTNGFVQVRVPTKATWAVGQHYFVRFMAMGTHAWTIHPFTACSIPSADPSKESELVFFIRPQGGFTARLANFVESSPNASVRVLLDGPYGSVHARTLEQSQRILVITGGSGAGWMLPFIEAFCIRHDAISNAEEKDGAGLRPSLRAILVTRDIATTSFFEEEIRRIIASHSGNGAALAVEIEIYYTGTQENKASPAITGQFLTKLDDPESKNYCVNEKLEETSSGSSSDKERRGDSLSSERSAGVAHHDGRPNFAAVVRDEAAATQQGGDLAVFVCGPLSMQSDVADAAAKEESAVMKSGKGSVYLHVEHFSWA
jgi:NAD(P)H-flavin reductase